jgi:predicted small secreted protein
MKKSTLLGTVVLVLAAAACLSLGGCNTVEGAGKDIEKAGEGIQNAAD